MSDMYLTYFTNKTIDEFNCVLVDLKSHLGINDILYLLVDNFDISNFKKYKITLSDKLITAIRKTLEYAVDTESMIFHIHNVLEETS